MVCFRGCHIANHHAVVLWSCVLYFTTSPKWNLHCRVRDAATQRLQIRTNSASRKFASWCCGTLKVLDRQLRKRRWFAQNGNGGPNVGVHQCNKMCFLLGCHGITTGIGDIFIWANFDYYSYSERMCLAFCCVHKSSLCCVYTKFMWYTQ